MKNTITLGQLINLLHNIHYQVPVFRYSHNSIHLEKVLSKKLDGIISKIEIYSSYISDKVYRNVCNRITIIQYM